MIEAIKNDDFLKASGYCCPVLIEVLLQGIDLFKVSLEKNEISQEEFESLIQPFVWTLNEVRPYLDYLLSKKAFMSLTNINELLNILALMENKYGKSS